MGQQNDMQQPDSGVDTSSVENGTDEDIDAALKALQITLQGNDGNTLNGNITKIPEINDYLKFLK